MSRPSTPIILAFATLYTVWGTTYLAIRWAVETMPPLLMASVRFLIAGGGLYLFLRARGVPRPAAPAWRATLPISVLLLVVGNGALCWAQQWVPSGISALLIASTPLWMVLSEAIASRRMPRPLVLVGVAVGFCGVGILLGTSAVGMTSGRVLLGMAAVVTASAAWSSGSVWSRHLPMARPAAMSTALQMLLASPCLLLASAVRGEFHSFVLSAVTWRSFAGFLYLIVGGSLVGFGVYVWLLQRTTPSRLSTYAYVNPVVAVVLGTVVEHEPFGSRIVLAMAIILGAVVLVLTSSSSKAARGHETSEGDPPQSRQACRVVD